MDPRPHTVNELVEEQVRRWLAQEAARARKPEEKRAPPPIVTISRQAWSRGSELGRAVSERLAFDFWDHELVDRIAEQSGAPELLLRALDEHARSVVEDLVAGALAGDAFTGREYRAQLLRVVHAVAEKGRAVVIGRGASFVGGPGTALRVRVVCPIEIRVQNLVAARGVRAREAEAEIARLDRDRQLFVRQTYAKDVADPVLYDLVVNTGTLTLPQAADVVVAAYAARFGAPTPDA